VNACTHLTHTSEVRFRGQTGTRLLTSRLTGFGPEADIGHSGARGWGFAAPVGVYVIEKRIDGRYAKYHVASAAPRKPKFAHVEHNGVVVEIAR
jgi:hypothetical protein